MGIKNFLLKIKPIKIYNKGRKFFSDPHYSNVEAKNQQEAAKKPARTDVLNFLLSLRQGDTTYLEIGVRNPNDNFKHVKATTKYSVDPGMEFKENPVDFQMTSDVFFQKLGANEVLSNDIKFDVIFIDGLHLSWQVDRDIENALKYIKDDGFVVLHDCNPPTEWHARESYDCKHTPAQGLWNGTTWKAFFKWRFNTSINSCCVDTDWGVGILSKTHNIGKSIAPTNLFYEYGILDENRKEHLNLIGFESLKMSLTK